MRVFEVDRPALVLGSTQPEAVVDAARAAATGIDVVRRPTGGGAVLVRPGELLWVDVWVPAGDRLWEDDVGRSSHWLGQAWVDALSGAGFDGAWHDGPLVRSRWSDLVCFAGLGPGEVTVGGRKVVGISQRRTREGARFQCAALLEWDPGALLDLLALGDEDRAGALRHLEECAAPIPVESRALTEALLEHVART